MFQKVSKKFYNYHVPRLYTAMPIKIIPVVYEEEENKMEDLDDEEAEIQVEPMPPFRFNFYRANLNAQNQVRPFRNELEGALFDLN